MDDADGRSTFRSIIATNMGERVKVVTVTGASYSGKLGFMGRDNIEIETAREAVLIALQHVVAFVGAQS